MRTIVPLNDWKTLITIHCFGIFRTLETPVGAFAYVLRGRVKHAHIASLLFGLEDFVSRGYKALRNEQAMTNYAN